MAICDVCGNDYDRTFTLSFSNAPGPAGTFDSFECAIHAMAPTCGHCADLRPLRGADHRARRTGRQHRLLLCPLRPAGR